jgi:hypothetical protein
MSNGIVNGTDGLESRFGTSFHSITRTHHALISSLIFCLTASLGINGAKSAYVPPHMRNAQRAAPTTNEYVLSFILMGVIFVVLLTISRQERLARSQ